MCSVLFSCALLKLFHLQRLRDISHKKSAELTQLYSQMRWLGQYNADLVLRNIDANTQLTSLGVRRRMLEEELAWTAGECDVQRAATEQKAQEAEAQTAELRHVRTALEQKEAELQRKEVELQHEKATVATLTGTLEEKGKALEEKEVVVWNAEATLKEKEDSLSSLEGVAQVQQEEAQRLIAGKYSRFRCCLDSNLS